MRIYMKEETTDETTSDITDMVDEDQIGGKFDIILEIKKISTTKSVFERESKRPR